MKTQQKSRPGLKGLNTLAKLMDAQFRIPGTNIRFGFDGLIGLVPGVGDLVSMAISGYIISTAAKKGASGFVMARMMLNVGIDTLVGAVPILGDIFDVFYKSNQRNIRLLQQHFAEGRHQGSAKKLLIPVVIVLLVFFAGLIYLFVKLIQWIF